MTKSTAVEVPITPMIELYWKYKEKGPSVLHGRLGGQGAVIDPESTFFKSFVREIGSAFTATVEQLSASYFAPNEPFAPSAPHDPTLTANQLAHAEEGDDPLEVKIARDIATHLFEASDQRLRVKGHADLDTTYVDYEVSVLRTLNGAKFASTGPHDKAGKASGRALIADLLLRGEGNLPTVTEVKLRADTSPLLGALQALTYVAHLAPEAQYARLSIGPGHSARQDFHLWSATQPILNAYVLLVAPTVNERGKVGALHRAAPAFIRALHAEPGIQRLVHRFELLQVDLSEGGAVVLEDGAITATRLTELA